VTPFFPFLGASPNGGTNSPFDLAFGHSIRYSGQTNALWGVPCTTLTTKPADLIIEFRLSSPWSFHLLSLSRLTGFGWPTFGSFFLSFTYSVFAVPPVFSKCLNIFATRFHRAFFFQLNAEVNQCHSPTPPPTPPPPPPQLPPPPNPHCRLSPFPPSCTSLPSPQSLSVPPLFELTSLHVRQPLPFVLVPV